MGNGGDVLTGLVVLGVVLFIYLLPWFVAEQRGHPNAGSIAVINIFLGWTFVGWVVALAMACSGIPADSRPARDSERLLRRADALERKGLTERAAKIRERAEVLR